MLFFSIMTLDKLKTITKPFWVPVITAVYLLITDDINPFILTALFFGYVGDLLLMKPRRSWFVAGAVSFLIGHLFYIYVFISQAGGITVFSSHPLICLLMLLPYIIYAVILKKILGKNVSSIFIAAVSYVGVLLLMSYASFLRVWNVSRFQFAMTYAGSILFIISDSLIAVRNFKRKFRGIGRLIVFTYITAQLMIVIGLS